MKKYIIIALLGVLATSCQSIYEEAYEAEQLYKAKKENPELVRGSLKGYEAKFMNIYESMLPSQQREYKAYRERENKKVERELAQMKRAREEAIEMLNN